MKTKNVNEVEEFKSLKVKSAKKKTIKNGYILKVFNFNFDEINEYAEFLKPKYKIEYLKYCLNELEEKYHLNPKYLENLYDNDTEKVYKYIKNALDKEIAGQTNIKQKMQPQIEKLKWMGSERQLRFVLDQLIKASFLQKRVANRVNKAMSEHFIKEDDTPFIPNQISSSKYSYSQESKTGEPTGTKKIKSIVQRAKDLKE